MLFRSMMKRLLTHHSCTPLLQVGMGRGYSAHTSDLRASSFGNAISIARPYGPLTPPDQTQSSSLKGTTILFLVYGIAGVWVTKVDAE